MCRVRTFWQENWRFLNYFSALSRLHTISRDAEDRKLVLKSVNFCGQNISPLCEKRLISRILTNGQKCTNAGDEEATPML